MTDPLTIAGTALSSRLFVGTAGYPNQQVLLDCLKASGAEIVTVSIRRISLEGYAESLVDLLGGRYRLLPNTAGCATVRDAVLTAELAREALETDWVKLELIGDRETLYPDVEQLVRAAEELVGSGFTVLPYCNEDPVTCQKLADVGCAAVMPLGSLIGSGMGIANPAAREPVVTYLLIGLCVGAFLWQLGQYERAVLYSYGMIPAELFGLWHPPRAYQGIPAWSKLLTSMFLHGGWFHLIGNMLFL